MRVIIAGSRKPGSSTKILELLDEYLKPYVSIIECVISGHAVGADKLGEVWAARQGFTTSNGKLKIMPAEWDKFGLGAGHKRNAEMAQIASHCICFWDGSSAGTKGMVEVAIKKGLWVKVVRMDKLDAATTN